MVLCTPVPILLESIVSLVPEQHTRITAVAGARIQLGWSLRGVAVGFLKAKELWRKKRIERVGRKARGEVSSGNDEDDEDNTFGGEKLAERIGRTQVHLFCARTLSSARSQTASLPVPPSFQASGAPNLRCCVSHRPSLCSLFNLKGAVVCLWSDLCVQHGSQGKPLRGGTGIGAHVGANGAAIHEHFPRGSSRDFGRVVEGIICACMEFWSHRVIGKPFIHVFPPSLLPSFPPSLLPAPFSFLRPSLFSLVILPSIFPADSNRSRLSNPDVRNSKLKIANSHPACQRTCSLLATAITTTATSTSFITAIPFNFNFTADGHVTTTLPNRIQSGRRKGRRLRWIRMVISASVPILCKSIPSLVPEQHGSITAFAFAWLQCRWSLCGVVVGFLERPRQGRWLTEGGRGGETEMNTGREGKGMVGEVRAGEDDEDDDEDDEDGGEVGWGGRGGVGGLGLEMDGCDDEHMLRRIRSYTAFFSTTLSSSLAVDDGVAFGLAAFISA
ncbi:hypothetical protein ONZ45_g18000 [Pleurotus djamor]|nr:hypothetical protein ONZ45_g18000 [Pleurotus djamor]